MDRKLEGVGFTIFLWPLYWLCQCIASIWWYRFKPYDPAWLVNAALKEYPDDVSLHEALRKCRMAAGKIPMIYFVSPKWANLPGSEWQFKENVMIELTCEGAVILDVLKDGRIGGVEFYDKLFEKN